jgi:2-dehydro-3-deoxyphosphogluconate aldolase/(4S)-4-hydroxy-2-oxoglutarate aldolase
MNEILSNLEKIGVIPVIKIEDAAKAAPLADALERGGLPCAEITFRTDCAAKAIQVMREKSPAVLTGAGTVLTKEHVDRAVDAGAQFIVSPGFNPKIVSHCIEKNIPVVPGCAAPSDMERALEMGLSVVKFFPAEQAGGLNYLKAVSAAYPSLKFIPTGGINPQNIAEYTRFEKVLACGGSWMVSAELINAGNFEKIATLCSEAVGVMLGFSFAHLGINTENEDETRESADFFEKTFGFFQFSQRETPISIFAGDGVEIMKGPGKGAKGHIAVAVNDAVKAKYHLERRGLVFDEQSLKYSPAGRLNLLYLKDAISGFAVHLVQKK